MNKNKVRFIANKDSFNFKKQNKTKQNIEYQLKGNSFFVGNGRYRFFYTITGICAVLPNLAESQKDKIYFISC